MVLALSVLGLLMVATVWSLASSHWLPAIVVILVAVLWVLTNGPVEGPVLWTVAPGHGLTVADLLAPLCAGVGLVRLVMLWWQHKRRPSGVPDERRTVEPHRLPQPGAAGLRTGDQPPQV